MYSNIITFERNSITEEEVRKEVWSAYVPIEVSLSANETSTLEAPNKFYELLPRTSYLALVSGSVRQHFLSATPAIVDELWFEHKGKPLKWHYPIGVLFDCLGNNLNLPWSLVVHFQGFPSEQLLRCTNEDTVKHHFMNVLKEANYIKHGDSSKINNLSVSDSNDLWEGLKNNDFNQFWRSNIKLVGEEPHWKHIALRVFVKGDFTLLQEGSITPYHDSGVSKTLGEVASEFLKNLFDRAENPQLEIVIQGITPTLDTPIVWLATNCSYPDNFLYIIIRFLE